MRRACVFGIALTCMLLGCSETTKVPADSPDQGRHSASSDVHVVALFADTSLAAAVREALGKPAGPVLQADLDSLTQLVARSRGISDLTGIDTVRGLQVLDLAGNRITDLSPLAGLTQLRLLDLEDNEIADLSPLAGLSRLELLVLSGNRIIDVAPLLALQGLRSLELGRNPLGQAALDRQVPALQARGVQVSVDQAPVVEPPTTGPAVFADRALEAAVRKALKKTDPNFPLSREELLTITSLRNRTLPIPGAPDTIADLAGIEQLANLDSLDLAGNKVSDLSPLTSLVHLEKLTLWGNQVSDLSPLSGLQELGYLDLGANQVSDLSPLSQLHRLLTLRMLNNQISDLSPLAALTQLENLALANSWQPDPDWGANQVNDISPLMSLVHLKVLDLVNNQIQDISALMHLPELVRVDLTGNPLNEESRLSLIPALRSHKMAVIF